MKKKVAYQDIIFTFQGIESVFHKSSLLFNNQSNLLTINQVGSQTAYHLNLRGIKSIYKENVVVNQFFSSKINNELNDLYVDGSKLLCFALH